VAAISAGGASNASAGTVAPAQDAPEWARQINPCCPGRSTSAGPVATCGAPAGSRLSLVPLPTPRLGHGRGVVPRTPRSLRRISLRSGERPEGRVSGFGDRRRPLVRRLRPCGPRQASPPDGTPARRGAGVQKEGRSAAVSGDRTPTLLQGGLRSWREPNALRPTPDAVGIGRSAGLLGALPPAWNDHTGHAQTWALLQAHHRIKTILLMVACGPAWSRRK